MRIAGCILRINSSSCSEEFWTLSNLMIAIHRTPSFSERHSAMPTLFSTPEFIIAMGYLLGSIPFGIILTRLGGAGDLRQVGSGNIGATNVLRTGRKGLAAATLLLDLAKGAVAVCVARMLSPDSMTLTGVIGTLSVPAVVLAGAAAMIGHCYPVWLGFRGGKGVATLMGVVLALDWRLGAIFAVVWIGTIALMRISSLGGILAALSVPVAVWALDRPQFLPFAAAMAALVVWRHRDNVARLLSGTEPRIGGGKAAAASEPAPHG
jgi:acyl phosphate:glycerol-3-phosphate acyltransferase